MLQHRPLLQQQSFTCRAPCNRTSTIPKLYHGVYTIPRLAASCCSILTLLQALYGCDLAHQI